MRKIEFVQKGAWSLLFSFAGMLAHSNENLGDGWKIGGSQPELYEAQVSPSDSAAQLFNGRLSSKGEKWPNGFVTLLRKADVGSIAGKQITLRATISANAVAGRGQLWIRVDSADGQQLALVNMRDDPVKGTFSGKPFYVTLKIPPDGTKIVYGILLAGRGEIHFEDLRLDGAPTPASEETK